MRKELSLLAGVICCAGITGAQAQSNDGLLPPNAKAGECYARVYVPPRYESRTEQVMVQPASERVEYTAPKYEWVNEKQLVKPAFEDWKAVPAKFDWTEERVLVEEASEQLKFVPAEYEWVEEKVLVRPAYTTWKRGRGLIERIDEATGEIMCRVEVPAVYETVKKKVLKSAARTEKVMIPAKYRAFKKQVMVSEPKMVKTTMPAQYAVVRVRKLVAPPEAKRMTLPAKFETIEKTVRVSDGSLEWRSVLCETNAGPDLITQIQRALKGRGFDPGLIDGVVGGDTMAAVVRYQEARNLSTGKLTLETIRSLGVETPSTRTQ